ncbi:MAG: ABC transporter ATP-binding protein [Clostridia bacterium]|nr:ABC transporter ATP-binding protein [Clostridia bacterium]
MYAIKTEDLTKYYGKTRGIEKVSLQVEQGDFFGFIGPNGAGKSTLIRTLLGLISKTSGQAEILSMDVSKKREEILSRIGYLPSETALYSGMKVKDALALSARLRKADCHSEAEALCKRLELDPERQIDRLSLGNRKKVGIVCALQHKPDLYILDEPTSGLDPLMQKEFYAILKERNEQGATVFLSSHVLSEIGRYCKNAAIIRNGQILACDSVERLGHTGVKKVQLRGARETPSLEGIKDVKRENDTLSFLYSGQIGALLEALLDLAPADVSLTDPELDEVFLHYYAKEEM